MSQLKLIPKADTTQRFWDKVNKTHSCWNWIGGKDSSGYGVFRDKIITSSHRFSYQLHKDKIPNGLEIDHLCRNRSCVNPDHLEVVTHQENTKRGNAGLHERIKTHCPQGHEYDKENTQITTHKNGNYKRSCRMCNNINWKKWKLANPKKYKKGWKKYNLKKYHGKMIIQEIKN